MTAPLLYLSGADIRGLGISLDAARAAILSIFRDHAAGLCRANPKSALDLGPGHGFQAMPSASAGLGLAAVKWVAMAPVQPGSAIPGINATICVNDYGSGLPLAMMDGGEITLIRTAALSAAAAEVMAPADPRCIAMIGCGLQAEAHLAAFTALFPGLRHVQAFSRTPASAARLVGMAADQGLSGVVTATAQEALRDADIVISMVPGAPGLVPFLDARSLKPRCFVSAVDIGRSWLPESFPAFDLLATDSLEQSHAPYDIAGKPVTTARFSTDLARLSAGEAVSREGRSLFCFRGFSLADLALAALVLDRARASATGLLLPR